MKTSKEKTKKTAAKLAKGKLVDPRVARRAALAQVIQMGEGVVTPDKDSVIPEANVDLLEQEVEAAYVEATVGKLLETARQKRKLGKRELSRKLGTNHARISQLEGAENLELKSIIQVLDSLNYDLELHLVSRVDGNVIRARV
jgi:ribosome-binding protein aMBF1 (putative translation factor)